MNLLLPEAAVAVAKMTLLISLRIVVKAKEKLLVISLASVMRVVGMEM